MINLVVNGVEYGVCLVTPALQEKLDHLYDSGRLSELIDPHSLLAAVRPGWPTPPATEWPRPRLGGLYWPVVGAARYAFGVYLVDSTTLGLMKAGMVTAGTKDVVVRFRDLPDPTLESPRNVPMRFLADRPLVENGSGDGYIVLLVDDRYDLLHDSEDSFSATTWAQVVTGFGGTVADAVDSDYLTPSIRWTGDRVRGRSAAWLLDIAALCVGSRIVKVPGGALSLQRPTPTNLLTASAAHDALVTGLRFFGGGTIGATDYTLPTETATVFGGPDDSAPVAVSVGTVGTRVTHWCDGIATLTGGQRSALAAQWDADWRAWQEAPVDAQYAGFVPAAESGFIWAVEWFHSSTQGYTRYVRPPHRYGYLLAPATGVETTEYGCGLSFADGSVTVDYDALIATDGGLEVVAGTPPACDGLQVKAGCNITVNNEGVSVDAEALAGDGLEAYTPDGEDCVKMGVLTGCHLEIDGDGKVAVTPDTLYAAGSSGLTTGAPVGDCDTMQVAVGCLIELDELGRVAFNHGNLLAADSGLAWTVADCPELYVDIGCNLEIAGDGKVQVNTTVLAGDASVTAMEGAVDGDGCPVVAFDYTSASTTTETLVNDVTVAQTGATVTIVKTRTTYTNNFNAAGVHVNRTAGAPANTTYTVDICLGVKCCLAPCVRLKDVVWTDQYGTGPLEPIVEFNVTGGVPTDGEYTVTIDWDTGDTDTLTGAGPFEFIGPTIGTPGLYEVVITVTDQCGDHTFTYPIVVGELCACTDCETTGYPQAYDFALEGATGDFADLNGLWELRHKGACQWAWIQDGWTAVLGVASGVATATFTDDHGNQVTYVGAVANCCDGSTNIVFDAVSGTGVGDTPTFYNDEFTPNGTCEPCCETEPAPGECCTDLPDTVTLTVTAGPVGLNGWSAVLTKDVMTGNYVYTGGTGLHNQASMSCLSGTYTVSITGACDPGPDLYGVSMTSTATCCSPFSLTATGTPLTGCHTSTPVTVVITP